MKRIKLSTVLAIAALILSACSGTNKGLEVGNPNPTTDESQPTFRSMTYGVSITYPAGWQANAVSDDEVRFAPASGGNGGSVVANFHLLDAPAGDLTALLSTTMPGDSVKPLTPNFAQGFESGIIVEQAAAGRSKIILTSGRLVVMVSLPTDVLSAFTITCDGHYATGSADGNQTASGSTGNGQTASAQTVDSDSEGIMVSPEAAALWQKWLENNDEGDSFDPTVGPDGPGGSSPSDSQMAMPPPPPPSPGSQMMDVPDWGSDENDDDEGIEYIQ